MKAIRALLLLPFVCQIVFAHEHGRCNHDQIIDVADEEHWTSRRLRLLNDDRSPMFPHKLSRTELHRELTNRGIEFSADVHRRKLQSDSHMNQIRAADWRPLRVTYVKVDWGKDPALTQEKAQLLEQVMDGAVEILKNTFSVRIDNNPLRVSRDCVSFFGNGKCALLETDEYCGRIAGDANVLIPASMYDEAEECTGPDSCTTIAAGAGMQNSDFVLYATANHTRTCEGGTLAYALSCKHDEIERPIMGRTNFCPTKLSPSGVGKAINTAVHEILHALGFSASYFWRWRDPVTLDPLTPRNANGYPSGDNTASCNYRNVYFPGDKIAQTFAERGIRQCTSKQTRFDANNCITKIVTPLSVRAARWFSGCDTLQGIELENQAPGSCHNTGSHMEQRIWDDNIMTPLLGDHPGMSAPVLAMMEDSGWFRANWTAQDTYQQHGGWGFKQGCGFFKDNRCIGENGALPESSERRYCTFKQSQMCSHNYKSVSYCNIQTYSGALPPQFRYFGDSRLGGVSYVDYCPMIVPYSNGDCSVASNAAPSAATGSEYTDGARCYISTVMSEAHGFFPGDPIPRCMKSICNKQQDGSYTVTVEFYTGNSNEAAPTVTCTQAGTVNAPTGYMGTIECPDPQHACFETSDIWVPGPNASDPIPPLPSASASSTPSTIPLPSATASPTAAPGCTHYSHSPAANNGTSNDASEATPLPSVSASPMNPPQGTAPAPTGSAPSSTASSTKPSSSSLPSPSAGSTKSPSMTPINEKVPSATTTPSSQASPSFMSTSSASSAATATPAATQSASNSAAATSSNTATVTPTRTATPSISTSSSAFPTVSSTPPPTVSPTASITAGASPSSTPAPPPVVKAAVKIDDVECDESLTRAGLTKIIQNAVANVAQVLPSQVDVNITSGCDDPAPGRRLQAATGVTADVTITGSDDMEKASSTATALEDNVQDGSLVSEMKAVAPPAAVAKLARASASAQVVVEQPIVPVAPEPNSVEAETADEEGGGLDMGIVAGAAGGAVVVLVMVFVYFRCCRKQKKLARRVSASDENST